MAEYSEGICGDGAAILKDGAPMKVHEIVAELNRMAANIEDLQELLNSWESGNAGIC